MTAYQQGDGIEWDAAYAELDITPYLEQQRRDRHRRLLREVREEAREIVRRQMGQAFPDLPGTVLWPEYAAFRRRYVTGRSWEPTVLSEHPVTHKRSVHGFNPDGTTYRIVVQWA